MVAWVASVQPAARAAAAAAGGGNRAAMLVDTHIHKCVPGFCYYLGLVAQSLQNIMFTAVLGLPLGSAGDDQHKDECTHAEQRPMLFDRLYVSYHQDWVVGSTTLSQED